MSEDVDETVNLQFGYISFSSVSDNGPEHLSFEQVLFRVAAQRPQQLEDDDQFVQGPKPELFCFIASCYPFLFTGSQEPAYARFSYQKEANKHTLKLWTGRFYYSVHLTLLDTTAMSPLT